MSTHNDLGKLGEKMAQDLLVQKGYTLLETNWMFQKAEIDIIAQKDVGTLVIVEVKTRTGDFVGNPEEFVSKKKIKLLVMAAHQYIISCGLDVEVRFDIIAIVKNPRYQHIEHLENAFCHFI